ncbi:MAG: hypothetical protein R3B51_03850 [Thermodesulfobacteriota bacterium]
MRVALDSLGEITGEVTTEDVLGRIFSKFCVGEGNKYEIRYVSRETMAIVDKQFHIC